MKARKKNAGLVCCTCYTLMLCNHLFLISSALFLLTISFLLGDIIVHHG
jgi:hypothetical protein